MSSRPPLLTRPFLLLVCGHFLQALGFSSMLLLPLYLEHLGASRAEIGAIMAIASLGGLLVKPIVGWLLDTWGRRRTVLAGTAALVAAMLGLFFVRSLGPLIYLDRILFGVGAGTLFTGYFTWATDLIPPGRRTEGIALFGISGLLPLALNGFVNDVGLTAPDLRLLFAALGGVIALSALALLPVPETQHADDPAAPQGPRAVLRALGVRRLWPVWLATALFAGLVGVFMAFATVTAKARALPDPPAVWLSYSLGAVGVRLIGARLPDRLGPRNLVAPALAFYLLAFVTLAGATSQRALLLAGLLGGLGHGYCFPVVVSLVVARSHARWRGSAVAGFTAVWQLSELALPPLLGLVADAWSDAALYGVAVAGGAAGLAAWAALEHAWGGCKKGSG